MQIHISIILYLCPYLSLSLFIYIYIYHTHIHAYTPGMVYQLYQSYQPGNQLEVGSPRRQIGPHIICKELQKPPQALRIRNAITGTLYRARCFRIINVSTITASIPLTSTSTDFEPPFKQPK